MAKAKDIAKVISKGYNPRATVWMSTGPAISDLVFGAGKGYGAESGLVINLVSPSGAGKSFLCSEIIASAYHKFGDKFRWFYDDAEHAYRFDSMGLYGFNIVPEGQLASTTIEECFGRMVTFLQDQRDDEFSIYVLDSIDAVTSEEIESIQDDRVKAYQDEKEYTKGSFQSSKPKFLSSVFLPKIKELAKEKNCLIIIISQLRDNVGGGLYAPKDKVSNGRALLYYCDAQIWLRALAKNEVAGVPIGYTMHITTKKVRGNKPYREGMINIYYDMGIDVVGSDIDYLYSLRTDAKGELKKTAKVKWDDVEMSRDELISHIETNNLEEELRSRCIAKWDEIESKATAELTGRKKRFNHE